MGKMPSLQGWPIRWNAFLSSIQSSEYINKMETEAYNLLAERLGLKTDIGRKALSLAIENIKTLDRKQQDYGSQNIARHGQYGVIVRCDDKTARLANLINKETTQNESVLDSWLDLANYGIIGALVSLGEWE